LWDFPRRLGEERTTKRIAELSAPVTPEAMERDDSDYVDFLAAQDSVSEGAMGVVGHCFTGAMAMRAATARPDRIAAAASFHGVRLFTDAPTSPHLILPRVKARLYFAHAVKDNSMPEEAIEKFNRALEAWGAMGNRYESEIYEGAYHGWTALDSPVYNEAQAERAFEKIAEQFVETLKYPRSAKNESRWEADFMRRLKRNLFYLLVTVFTPSFVIPALAQKPGDEVQVRLSLAGGKSVYRAGEPI